MSFLRAPDTESSTEFVRLTSELFNNDQYYTIKYIFFKNLLYIYPITKDYLKKELILSNIKLIPFIYKIYFNDS